MKTNKAVGGSVVISSPRLSRLRKALGLPSSDKVYPWGHPATLDSSYGPFVSLNTCVTLLQRRDKDTELSIIYFFLSALLGVCTLLQHIAISVMLRLLDPLCLMTDVRMALTVVHVFAMAVAIVALVKGFVTSIRSRHLLAESLRSRQRAYNDANGAIIDSVILDEEDKLDW